MFETLTVCVCLQLNNMLLKLHQPPVVHKRQTRSVRSYSLVCFVSMQYGEKNTAYVRRSSYVCTYSMYMSHVSLALMCLWH